MSFWDPQDGKGEQAFMILPPPEALGTRKIWAMMLPVCLRVRPGDGRCSVAISDFVLPMSFGDPQDRTGHEAIFDCLFSSNVGDV